jgi:hypothetical protein
MVPYAADRCGEDWAGKLIPADIVGVGAAAACGDQEDYEVGKITLDRPLIGTQPLVKPSELVRGQRGRRPLWLGRDLGDVAARIGDQGVVPASNGAYARENAACGLGQRRAVARCRKRRSTSSAPPKARRECAC